MHFVVINEYFDGASDTGTDGDVVNALYIWLDADLSINTKPIVLCLITRMTIPQWKLGMMQIPRKCC